MYQIDRKGFMKSDDYYWKQNKRDKNDCFIATELLKKFTGFLGKPYMFGRSEDFPGLFPPTGRPEIERLSPHTQKYLLHSKQIIFLTSRNP